MAVIYKTDPWKRIVASVEETIQEAKKNTGPPPMNKVVMVVGDSWRMLAFAKPYKKPQGKHKILWRWVDTKREYKIHGVEGWLEK